MQANSTYEAERRKGLRPSLQGLPMDTIDKMVEDAATCLRTELYTKVIPQSHEHAVHAVADKMEERFDSYEAEKLIGFILSEDRDSVFNWVKEQIDAAIECHIDDIFWSER